MANQENLMNIHQSALIIPLVLAVSIVGAHDGLHGPVMQYDVDRNDQLSLSEYVAYIEATDGQTKTGAEDAFTALDTDHNGYLSNAEFILSL